MICDYTRFTDILTGKGSTGPTLFEPFISRMLVEQLIWRRGDTVWQTPEARMTALISLRERTLSDVIVLDVQQDAPDMAEILLSCAATMLPVGSALVVIADDEETLSLCDRAAHVCAIASKMLPRRSDKPFIRMGGSFATALSEHADGYFASEKAEELLAMADGKMTVLGGLGIDFMMRTGPASILRRCAALMDCQRYILGSGGEVGEYSALISMLGAYGRRRR